MQSRPSRSKARKQAAIAMDAIRRIVRVLRLSARASEKALGVSGAQLFVLQRLAEGPAASLRELAARTLTDQSSVSVVAQRLVDAGLVTRTVSSQDARRQELSLTRAGRAMVARTPPTPQVRMMEALERLAGRRGTLAEGLRALVREMGAEGEAAALFFEGESRRNFKRSSNGNAKT